MELELDDNDIHESCIKAILKSMELIKLSLIDNGEKSYEQGKRDGAKETAQFVIDNIKEYLR